MIWPFPIVSIYYLAISQLSPINLSLPLILKPTTMTTRRQFLGRSAMGAGSLLLTLGFSQGCTDHFIDPTNPIDPSIDPPLLGLDINWNEAAKQAIKFGLEKVPVVGEVLGPLVDILWPETKEDRWAEMKDEVEALIQQDLSNFNYDSVKNVLDGLQSDITDFLNELNVENGDPATTYIAVRESFAAAQSTFQQKKTGYELLLLPLFAQYANLYLSLLRDAAYTGQNWNLKSGDQVLASSNLDAKISEFAEWCTDTHYTGFVAVQKNTKPDYYNCEPFKSINAYNRFIQLTVFDFVETWGYLSKTINPDNSPFKTNREIYSDPIGSCQYSGDISLPTTTPPIMLPTKITVWGGVRIDAIQVDYDTDFQMGGPNDVGTTGRMGNANGGSNVAPNGGSFKLYETLITTKRLSPFTQVRAVAAQYHLGSDVFGPMMAALNFTNSDGITTGLLGSTDGMFNGVYQDVTISYDNQAISSIHVNGLDKDLDDIDCVVFGFQYWEPPQVPESAIRNMYIKSPHERPAADFLKEFKHRSVAANLITEQLKAARKAYWARFKQRFQ